MVCVVERLLLELIEGESVGAMGPVELCGAIGKKEDVALAVVRPRGNTLNWESLIARCTLWGRVILWGLSATASLL